MIIACEPMCTGFEHSGVNAAMLALLAQAYPEKNLQFLAEAGHLEYVAKDPAFQGGSTLSLEVLAVPPRSAAGAERLDAELRTVRQLFERSRVCCASLLVLTCAGEVTLRAIKTLLPQFPQVRCAVVLHGGLASLSKRPSFFPWKNRHTFRTWLLRDNDPRLTYIVLGKSIERELVLRFPELQPFVVSVDLPYHYAAPQEHVPFQNGTVNFGALGVLRKVKGSHQFLSLAKEVCSVSTRFTPRFICVGPVVDKKLRKLLDDTVYLPSPDAPLTQEAFAAHAQALDYSVFLHSSEAYALTASGVLFDAFSYLKPVIALRSPFFCHYFELMGDIGYLCDSYDDLKRTVLRVLADPPAEEYQRQRLALQKGRELLQIPRLAAGLREKISARLADLAP
jgi:hypothetical protein